MGKKYVCTSDSLRPGQLDRLVSTIKDFNPNCKHLNYKRQRVMDFNFYVCCDCGFQWKA